MAYLPRPMTIRMSSRPACTASSTTYWMAGLSTTGTISFGCAFEAGRKRVPSPAAGMTAFRTFTSAKPPTQVVVDSQGLAETSSAAARPAGSTAPGELAGEQSFERVILQIRHAMAWDLPPCAQGPIGQVMQVTITLAEQL